MAGDSNFDKNLALLLCQGADNSTSFPDTSRYQHRTWVAGNTKITSNKAAFDGTGDLLYIGYSPSLMFLNGDFTLEMIVNTTQTTTYATLCANTSKAAPSSNTIGNWRWYINPGSSNGYMGFGYMDYSTGVEMLLQTSGTAVNTGSDVHIAITRSGSTWTLWRHGTSVASTTHSGTGGDDFQHIAFGGDIYYGRSFNGSIGPIRLSNYARYTGSFTPPAAADFLDYAGQITGSITESFAIEKWRVTALTSTTKTLAGTASTTIGGTSYSINCNTLEMCDLYIEPHIDGVWSASKVVSLDEYYVPSNPNTTQRVFKVTTAGTFDVTEASWPASGTVNQGTAVLTFVANLDDGMFKTIGFKFPS